MPLNNPLHPLRLEVAPVDASPLPVNLDLIKQHSAIDSSDFDTLMETYLLAAIAWAEGAMHRTIFARSHTWVLRGFPCDVRQEIRLPRGKTQSVESIEYVHNGATVALTGPSSSPAGTDYQEDLTGDDGGVVMPNDGAVWPAYEIEVPAPVTIKFTAGWQPAQVPSEIIHALLFAVNDAFEMRGAADMNAGPGFQARNALISAYRLTRFY